MDAYKLEIKSAANFYKIVKFNRIFSSISIKTKKITKKLGKVYTKISGIIQNETKKKIETHSKKQQKMVDSNIKMSKRSCESCSV